MVFFPRVFCFNCNSFIVANSFLGLDPSCIVNRLFYRLRKVLLFLIASWVSPTTRDTNKKSMSNSATRRSRKFKKNVTQITVQHESKELHSLVLQVTTLSVFLKLTLQCLTFFG